MGRSAFYTSPASKVRSLKRAIQYFKMKAISNLRKIPDLDVQCCAVVDIPPTHNIRNLPPQELKKNCYPFQPVKPSSISNNLFHVNQPILHQNLPPTKESSRIRTTKCAKRRLPPQPPTGNLKCCYQKCPVTGSWIQTV